VPPVTQFEKLTGAELAALNSELEKKKLAPLNLLSEQAWRERGEKK
jgi:hypothetical protein